MPTVQEPRKQPDLKTLTRELRVDIIRMIEVSTGSLGQGLSIAVGMALAARLDKKDYRTWCVLGDGEMQEGQVWEAAMSAPKFKLGNLTAIVDCNGGQIDGPVEEIMDLRTWSSSTPTSPSPR